MSAAEPRLRRLVRFAEAVRQIDPLLPTQALHVLLVVAEKAGASTRDIAGATGLQQSSVSRNIHALGSNHRNGKLGYGLVAQVPDPYESRADCVFLTSKGREVVRRLLQAATGEPAADFNPRVVR